MYINWKYWRLAFSRVIQNQPHQFYKISVEEIYVIYIVSNARNVMERGKSVFQFLILVFASVLIGYG